MGCVSISILAHLWYIDADMLFDQRPFLAIKHFLPKLELASEPKIVNISSAFGSISGKSDIYSCGRDTIKFSYR